jgi:hypothetical protein
MHRHCCCMRRDLCHLRQRVQLFSGLVHHLRLFSAQCPIRAEKHDSRIIRVLYKTTLHEPHAALGHNAVRMSSNDTRRDTVHCILLRTKDPGAFEFCQNVGGRGAEAGRGAGGEGWCLASEYIMGGYKQWLYSNTTFKGRRYSRYHLHNQAHNVSGLNPSQNPATSG